MNDNRAPYDQAAHQMFMDTTTPAPTPVNTAGEDIDVLAPYSADVVHLLLDDGSIPATSLEDLEPDSVREMAAERVDVAHEGFISL